MTTDHVATDHVATRTLVKSPPELWAECSDAGSLARHIGEFGEITITRLEPETSVVWEGEHASGTVLIEPSGWGTRVTLTAQTLAAQTLTEQTVTEQTAPMPEPVEHEPAEEEADETVEEAVAEPDHAVAEDPGPVRRRWRHLIGRFRSRADEPEPDAPEPEPEPEPEPGELEMLAPPEPTSDPESASDPEPAGDPDTAEPDADQLDPEAILAAALDSLGQAHHRPFSRA